MGQESQSTSDYAHESKRQRATTGDVSADATGVWGRGGGDGKGVGLGSRVSGQWGVICT